MKRAIAAIAIALALAVSAFAADWQTGKIIVHPVKGHLVNLLEGVPESKWFHGTGDIICIGGDENHAPDCRHNTLYTPTLDGPDREGQFWIYGVTDSEEYEDVILADGEMFRVERYSPETIFKNLTRKRYLIESARVTAQQMKQMEPVCNQGVCKSGNPTATAATEGTFEYKLGKLKDGIQEIEIKIPDYPGPGIVKTKGFFKPAPQQ
jgi:hypothetical protein